ncbi:shikimate kinase [Candidatus Planktophila versatilis]|uniref:shikimate kinase n=1 Tax=Candidatus Planktophila versatilis TaxID=1884905 RepID=UPI000BACA4A5|nr:shikimate kinase [Candidatus Planktophila versatilis]ASY26422.1 shikimate kinase [Candidatus Planktophila versatilis]
MAPRIILIGPMGSGKSTIGKSLANKLSLEFRDTDSVIEQRENKSVSQIFIEDGEAAFRAIEREILQQELQASDTVLALGGGAPISTEAQSALTATSSHVVYLDISLANVAPRIGFNRDRPLLLNNPRGQWQTLMEARRPIYEAIADTVVDVNKRSQSEIVAQILEVLG